VIFAPLRLGVRISVFVFFMVKKLSSFVPFARWLLTKKIKILKLHLLPALALVVPVFLLS